jgi:hypothetical protein
MKKIYTLIGSVVITGAAFAQTVGPTLPTASVDRSTSTVDRASTSIARGTYAIHNKAIFLSEDFESVATPALPAGWGATTNATGGYAGFFTGDETDASAGGFWPVPNNGSTAFAMTNDDVANDILDAERLILPAVDLTGETGVGLSFDVFHDKNYGSGDASVEVSTDGGATWTNVLTIPVDAANWQYVVVNLGAYDGMTGVIVSFLWNDGGTPGADNWGTGLAVDNVVIETLPADELTSNFLINADIVNDNEYTILPIGQARPFGYSVSVSNNGTNAQPDVAFDYAVTGAGTDNGSATAIAIPALTLDTIIAVSAFTPATTGTYTLTTTATMAATEVNAADNISSMDFEVSDWTWARDQTTFDGAFRNIGGANGAGVKIGHQLIVSADQMFGGIDVGIASSVDHDGQVFFAELHYYDDAGGAWVLIDNTDDMTIDNATMGGTIVTLPFINGAAQVTAGMNLMVVAGHYGGAADASDHVRFATAGVAREGTVLGFDGTNSSFQLLSPPSPVVRLNGDLSLGINNVETSMELGQSFPNPTTGIATVSYSLKSSADITIEITDMTGKIVSIMNEGSKVAGNYQVSLNVTNLESGMYFYSLSNGTSKVTKTMTVVK